MTKQEAKKIVKRLKLLSVKLPDANPDEIMDIVDEIGYLMNKLNKARKSK